MAFGNSNAAQNNERSFEKAPGFVNIKIKVKRNGKEVLHKVGFLALKDSDPVLKRMREFCEQDEGNAQKLLERLVLDYKSADGSGAVFEVDL
jgi:hypothetical protein